MQITVERIATGFASPLYAKSPPGDPNTFFVLEKDSGRVMVFDLATNTTRPTPFFDIPANEMTTSGTRGLLGLAFHPDYATNGKLYLSYTDQNGASEIWEMQRSATDPYLADVSTKRLLLEIPRPSTIHNGGWIEFGPDGFLYALTGDSGGQDGGDPENAAQNIEDLRGKLLRIDVDGDDFPLEANRNYAIPADNPFVGTAGADEVFAYGLRNPWRASFDRETNDLYIADVGEFVREEVNFIPAGQVAGLNFGWRIMEGNTPTGYPGAVPPNHPSLFDPIYDYAHGVGDFQGFSVTGGYVYRNGGEADGLYFFADFVSDHLWTLKVVNGQATEVEQRDDEITVVGGGSLDQIASFAEGADGRLYAVGIDGELWRFTLPAEVLPPAAPASPGGDGGGSDGFSAALAVTGAALALAAWFF